MDIFFQDPTEIPLPPAETRIRALQATLLSDGRRLRVYLEIDPSQARPSADLLLTDASGAQLSAASVVESMTRKIELTLHLRRLPASLPYRLSAILYYQAAPPPPEVSPAEPVASQPPLELPPPLVVDRKEIEFE